MPEHSANRKSDKRFGQGARDATRPDRHEFPDAQKVVSGIRAVELLLDQNPSVIHRILLAQDSGNPRLYALQKKVRHLHIHYQQLNPRVLSGFSPDHQGVIALCHETAMLDWESVRPQLLTMAEEKKHCTVVVLSHIEDPRNLGACLRSCLALGATTILMPARGMCGITPAVVRSAAGAIPFLRLCRPANLEAALGELSAAGFHLTGLDAHTPTTLHQHRFSTLTLLAVGGEDRGLPPFIRKQCHAVVRIPMADQAHSFNASVALSLALYECARQKDFPDIH